MFGFFKKKVELTPKQKVIVQYKEKLKQLKSIHDKFLDGDTNILASTQEVILSDIELLGELYGSIVENSEEIEFKKDDDYVNTDKLMDTFLTPVGHFNRHILLPDNMVDVVKANIHESFITDIDRTTIDYNDYYQEFKKLFEQRDDLIKSKLKSKLKDLILKKKIEKKYNLLISEKFKELFSESGLENLRNDFHMSSTDYKKLYRLHFLEAISDSALKVDNMQSLVAVPMSINEDLTMVGEHLNDMLLNRNISMIYRT